MFRLGSSKSENLARPSCQPPTGNTSYSTEGPRGNTGSHRSGPAEAVEISVDARHLRLDDFFLFFFSILLTLNQEQSTFRGLFTRWIHEINPEGLGNVPIFAQQLQFRVKIFQREGHCELRCSIPAIRDKHKRPNRGCSTAYWTLMLTY